MRAEWDGEHSGDVPPHEFVIGPYLGWRIGRPDRRTSLRGEDRDRACATANGLAA